MTCNFCHGDATDTYRTKDGPRGVCNGCHDEHFGSKFMDCETCADTFETALLKDYVCAECREKAREAWLEEHPSGEPHDYERSPCELPRAPA